MARKKRIYRTIFGLIIACALINMIPVVGAFSAEFCAFRIMPLGDSITRGSGSTDISGYRKDLYNRIVVSDRYDIDFVGSLKNGPITIDNDHEGHSGFTASQIASRTYIWLKNNPAEVILLHAGTNGLSESSAEIDRALDEIDRFSKDSWVILSLIINRDPYSALTSTFNSNIFDLVQQRIASGDKIIVVDQENALIYPDDLSDSIHPNDAGYSKMAQVWLDGLEPLLNNLCSGPPDIVESIHAPILQGVIGAPYTYAVKAYGDPQQHFEFTVAPAGMTIDPNSGFITWTPAVAGMFDVTVAVSNSAGSDTQSFVVEIADPDIEYVIDNGDPGTTASGTWYVSSGPNPYGADSLFSKTISDTYTFETARSGMQALYLWWTYFENRSTAVPVEIYDGVNLIDTLFVNQMQNGGRWNLLGEYEFTGQARVVIVVDSSTKTTAADAVKFGPVVAGVPDITSNAVVSGMIDAPYTYDVEASGSPDLVYELLASPAGMTIDPNNGFITWTPAAAGMFDVTVAVSNSAGSDTQSFVVEIDDPDIEYVIDNGDPGATASGTWYVSSGLNPYGADSVFSKTVSDRFTFETARTGMQALYLWWTYFENRSTAVPVEIYDGVNLIDTLFVNQMQNGGRWNLLGEYEFTGQARVVIVVNSSTKTTSADAVKFVPVSAGTPNITSNAVVSGMIDAPYTYDVEASGSPDLVYELLASPAGMTIDPNSGFITWTPAAAGMFDVTVAVSNSAGSDTQSFVVEIDDPDIEYVIDNGDPGATASGTWYVSSGPNPYGADSVFSKSNGDSYSYETAVNGSAEVSLWWTYYKNRCTQVPVEIFDGSTLLDTQLLNQQSGGGTWYVLGSYRFNSTARVVIKSNGGCTTSADAVRWIRY